MSTASELTGSDCIFRLLLEQVRLGNAGSVFGTTTSVFTVIGRGDEQALWLPP